MRGLTRDLIRIATAVLSILLTVMGCDGPQTRVIVMSSKGPEGSNEVRATVKNGLATFQCIDSVAGACNYVLFLSDCPASGDKGSCVTKALEEFTLKTGASKQIAALPEDFKFCVGHGAKPAIPSCLK